MGKLPAVGSAVGTNTAYHWSQAFHTPFVYGVIESRDDEGKAQERGMNAVSRIMDFFSDPRTDQEEIQTFFSQFSLPNISITILSVALRAVSLFIITGGKAYIKRNGSYAVLLDKPGNMSGVFQERDVFILSTDAFTRYISDNELVSLFDHLDPQSLAEEIAALMQTHENSVGCTISFIELFEPVYKEKELDVPVVDSPRQKTFQTFVPFLKEQCNHAWVKWNRFISAGPKEKVQAVKRMVHRFRQMLATTNGKIACILGILLLVSVIIGVQKEVFRKKDTVLFAQVNEISRIYEEGLALTELNPVKARERMKEAKNMMDAISGAIKPTTKEGRQALELEKEIQNAYQLGLRSYLSEISVFYDISLLKKDSKAGAIAISDDAVVVLDTALATLYEIGFAGKNGQIIAGGDGFGLASTIDINGNTIYTWTPTGIHATDRITKKTTKTVIPKSEEWGTIAHLVSFGGNVYLLDTVKSRIWKYVKTTSGFSELREYLNPDTLPDLSKATGMVIDSSVWIGTTDGKILRFTQGKENTFVMKGLEDALGSWLYVSTNDTANNVYVLDRDNKRVVIFDKEGMYMAQYRWTNTITPKALAVSEKNSTILLLADDLLYGINIK